MITQKQVPLMLAKTLAHHAGVPLQTAAHFIWQMKRFGMTNEEIESIVSQPIRWRKMDDSDTVLCHTCGTDVPRELAVGNGPYYCSPACKEGREQR